MQIKYDIQVPESLAKQIAETIRDAIMEGRIGADERLPTESELADRFGVSRPTIREALKRLAAQNLIRSRRGPTGGTFVNRPSAAEVRADLANMTALLVSLEEFDLSEIAETRRELELVCCKLAAERRTDDQLAIMSDEIARQREPELSDVDFCGSDVRFHRALVDATGNPVLQFLMASVIEALQPITNLVIFRFRARAQIIEQHERIHAAIAERDAGAASAALAEQMRYLQDQYAEAQEWWTTHKARGADEVE
jgi:DNA-binding FadR family transcriptional regulator